MQNEQNYKKYVKEYIFDLNTKNIISYEINYLNALNPNLNSINYYFTSEPTEQTTSELPSQVISYTNIPTSRLIQTPRPTDTLIELDTNCPSMLNTTKPIPIKILTNNTENKNETKIFIISVCCVTIFLLIFLLYFYKYYVRYKKRNDENKKNDLDIEFGISYIDDL
jgi:hypothetical protein